MALRARFSQADSTERLLSGVVWAKVPVEGAILGADVAFEFDDFMSAGAALSSNALRWGKWEGFGSTGTTATGSGASATNANGELILTLSSTNNDTVVAGLGGTYGGPIVDTTKGNPFAFEGRVSFSNIAGSSASNAKLFGLTDPVVYSATTPITAGAVLADISVIGFRATGADGDGLDAVYKKSSTETVVQEEAQVLVADTFYKLGCNCDENGDVKFFVNGSQMGDDVSIDATNFPDNDYLTLNFGIQNEGTGGGNMKLDWAAVGQVK